MRLRRVLKTLVLGTIICSPVLGVIPKVYASSIAVTNVSITSSGSSQYTVTISGVNLPTLTGAVTASSGGSDYNNFLVTDSGTTNDWGSTEYNGSQFNNGINGVGVIVTKNTSSEIQFTWSTSNGTPDGFKLYLTPANVPLSSSNFSSALMGTNTSTGWHSTNSRETGVSANLTSGSLSLTPPSLVSPFNGFVLNGHIEKSYASLSPWSVTDATGTGNGWSVTVTGTQFKEVAPTGGFASGTSALTLPTGSLSLVKGGTVTAGVGSTPVDSTGGPLFKNVGSIIDGSSFTYLEANHNYGLGTYNITPVSSDLLLTLDPSTTKVDSVNYPNQPTPYETTITYSLISGPSGYTGSTISGMKGYMIPSGSTFSTSPTYSGTASTVFYGSTSTSWIGNSYNGFVNAYFPSPIYLMGVNIYMGTNPGTTETFTIKGYKNGSWVKIGSLTTGLSAGMHMLPTIPVTPGEYKGLSILLASTSSWVSLNSVTIQ